GAVLDPGRRVERDRAEDPGTVGAALEARIAQAVGRVRRGRGRRLAGGRRPAVERASGRALRVEQPLGAALQLAGRLGGRELLEEGQGLGPLDLGAPAGADPARRGGPRAWG